MKLRLIGDVHGRIGDYLALTKDCDYSIQVGDLSYDWSILEKVDPKHHKIIPGNHDAWPELEKYKAWALYPYGLVTIGTWEAFYLAGAYSIDRGLRMKDYDWFPEEELPFTELYKAYRQYMFLKPKVVISHELPTEMIEVLGMKGIRLDPPFKIKSTTQQTLQMMLEAHRPEQWYGGHWHASSSKKKDGCYFRCLAECEYKDIEV